MNALTYETKSTHLALKLVHGTITDRTLSSLFITQYKFLLHQRMPLVFRSHLLTVLSRYFMEAAELRLRRKFDRIHSQI